MDTGPGSVALSHSFDTKVRNHLESGTPSSPAYVDRERTGAPTGEHYIGMQKCRVGMSLRWMRFGQCFELLGVGPPADDWGGGILHGV